MRIGLISDTHLNSRVTDYSALEEAISELNKTVDVVLHAGDLTDGIHVYPGQEAEQVTQSVDEVIKATTGYLNRLEIPIYLISGNHDLSYQKAVGLDVVAQVVSQCGANIHYLGHFSGNISLQGLKFRLLHPSGAAPYGIGYPAQKYLRNLDLRQESLDWLVLGHFHKSYYANIQGVNCIGLPSFQRANDFSRRRGFGEEVGYEVLSLPKKGGFSIQRRRY